MRRALVAVTVVVVLSLGQGAGAGIAPTVLYVRSQHVIVASLEGSTAPVDLSAELGSSNFAEWSPDGNLVELVGAAGIFVVAPDGSRPRLLTPYASTVQSAPAWSPDGTTIAYSASDGIWTVPVAGGPPTRLAKGTVPGMGLAWSPDGSTLLFTSDRAIYSLPYPRGGAPTTLAAGGQAVWSPRGDRIAFVTDDQKVAVMKPNGSARHDVTATSSAYPRWLDDDTLSFTSFDRVRPVDRFDNGVRPNIYIARVDGSGQPLRLTGAFDDRSFFGDANAPAPSPDGAQIEFSWISGTPWRMNVDGTCAQPIAGEHEPGHYDDWAWQPGSSAEHVSCVELWTLRRSVPARIAVGRRSPVELTVENHGNRAAHGISLHATALTPHTSVACRCTIGTIAPGGARTVVAWISSSRWQRVHVAFRASRVEGELTPTGNLGASLDSVAVTIAAVPRRKH